MKLFFCALGLTLGIIVFGNTSIYGQNDANLTREIIVYQSDTIIYSNIFIQNPKIKTEPKQFYFWHRHDSISKTQGSWSGKLLHGKVEFFAPKKTLIKQGAFENGQKDGLWQEWYSDGVTKRKEHWKKGNLSGLAWDYDSKGNLLARTTFRNGKQKGKLEYDKNGKKIKKAASKPKEKPKNVTKPTKEEPKKNQKTPDKTGKDKNNTKVTPPNKNKKEPAKIDNKK